MSDSRYSEAAHRCSDIVRMHIMAGARDRWVAIRLSDGGTDGATYDSRSDAIRHQLHETQCAYLLIPWDDLAPRSAETYLRHVRDLYGRGIPLSHPTIQPMRPL